MSKGQSVQACAGNLEQTGIYIIRKNELLGPYTKNRVEELLDQGSLEPSDLVKIGPNGRPFPAAALSGEDIRGSVES